MVWENAVHSENHNDVEAFEVRMLDEIFYAGSRRRGQRSYAMPNLTVVIPDSLDSILSNLVARRSTSPDGVVTAAHSQYFQTWAIALIKFSPLRGPRESDEEIEVYRGNENAGPRRPTNSARSKHGLGKCSSFGRSK
jgi:hypothetical protein